MATEDAQAHEPASIGKAARAHDGRLKLAVDAVSMWFGSHLVLSDLNLKIREGEFVSIIGGQWLREDDVSQPRRWLPPTVFRPDPEWRQLCPTSGTGPKHDFSG